MAPTPKKSADLPKTPARSKASSKPGVTGKGRTFAQMLDNKRFTTRVLQKELRMGSRTIINAQADPSLLSLGDIFRLATLLREDVDVVLAEIVAEVKQKWDQTGVPVPQKS